MTPYDVIVIGSGAGGGTLVHQLAPSGKRILVLERGGWLAREPSSRPHEANGAELCSAPGQCRPALAGV